LFYKEWCCVNVTKCPLLFQNIPDIARNKNFKKWLKTSNGSHHAKHKGRGGTGGSDSEAAVRCGGGKKAGMAPAVTEGESGVLSPGILKTPGAVTVMANRYSRKL